MHDVLIPVQALNKYEITIHSFNSAFTRGMRRTLSLRSRITHNDDLKFGYEGGNNTRHE